MKSNQAATVRRGACVIMLLTAVSLAGCGRAKPLTTRELKERYAVLLMKGAASGMADLQAESFDPETLDLIDLRLYDGERILHAKRGEILIDPDGRHVSLRLHDVVGALTDDGEIVTIPILTTKAVKLPRKFVQAPAE